MPPSESDLICPTGTSVRLPGERIAATCDKRCNVQAICMLVMAGHDGATGSILDFGKIRHRTGSGADFVQQLQAVLALGRVVVVDLHLVEERIHRRA